MNTYRSIFKLVLMISCVLLGSVKAENVVACKFQITSGESAARILTLSESVYACMRKSDYRDLQITNGDGNPVPLWIVHPSSQKKYSDYRKSLKFNVDSVDTNRGYHQHLRHMVRSTYYIRNGSGYEMWQQRHTYPIAIVIENPDTEGNLNQLQIELEHKNSNTVSATVYLEYSNDLSRWTASSRPQKLFFQKGTENGFSRRQLQLGADRQWRYLRLVVLSDVSNFAASITRMEGIYERSRIVDPEYVWTEAASIQQLGNGQDWQFSVPDQLPVSRIRFQPSNNIVYYSGLVMSKPIDRELPEDNVHLGLRDGNKKKLKNALKRIVTGQKRSFESINHGWGSITRFQQYHFEANDKIEESVNVEPIFFPHKSSRHWRITFEHPSSEMIASKFPVVEFGWTAARVRFLAQGPGPFQLVVGASEGLQRPGAPAILQSRSKNFEQVDLMPIDESGASRDPLDLPGSESDQGNKASLLSSEVVVWIILIVAVLVMVFMAWQLIRSIEKKTAEDD